MEILYSHFHAIFVIPLSLTYLISQYSCSYSNQLHTLQSDRWRQESYIFPSTSSWWNFYQSEFETWDSSEHRVCCWMSDSYDSVKWDEVNSISGICEWVPPRPNYNEVTYAQYPTYCHCFLSPLVPFITWSLICGMSHWLTAFSDWLLQQWPRARPWFHGKKIVRIHKNRKDSCPRNAEKPTNGEIGKLVVGGLERIEEWCGWLMGEVQRTICIQE